MATSPKHGRAFKFKFKFVITYSLKLLNSYQINNNAVLRLNLMSYNFDLTDDKNKILYFLGPTPY